MQIAKRKRLVYSTIGDLKVGDIVLTPTTKEDVYDKAKVAAIQEQGVSDVYIIELSDGRSYRTHIDHYTTVCFRQENGKDVWDTLTTRWMMNHPEYHFTILPNIKVFNDYNIIDMLPCHEAEPSDNISPIVKEGIYIKKIYKAPYKENCRCISLNDPLGLYYTNEGIITHNSTLTALVNLYISTLFAMMWHPYKYFGLSSATVFVQALGAWSQKKGSEILLEPIKNIIESSPYFTQVRGHSDMIEGNADPTEIAEHLNWTTATKTAQPLDCKVYLPDGTYKLMGDIHVGDKIASPTYGEVTVEAIPYHGIDICYEIELEDGRKTRCNAEHLWKVSWEKDELGQPIWKVVQTQFMIDHPELEFEIFDLEDV